MAMAGLKRDTIQKETNRGRRYGCWMEYDGRGGYFLWLLFYVWVFYLLGGGASGSGRGFMGRSLTQERRNKNDMTTKRRKK